MIGLRQIFIWGNGIKNDLQEIKVTLGRIEQRQCKGGEISKINDVEFKVFSQWGEDGIIQYLIHSLEIPQ